MIVIFQPVFSQVRNNSFFVQAVSWAKSSASLSFHYLFKLALGFFVVLLLLTHTVSAVERLSFSVEKIDSKDWQLNDVSLTLSAIQQQSQQLSLSIKQLSLPAPFQHLNIFDVQCLNFNWQENKIICQQGKAKLKSNVFESSGFAFSFSITEQQSYFNIQDLKLAKGTLSLSEKLLGQRWLVNIKSKDIQLQSIKSFLSKIETPIDEISKGYLNADVFVQGNDNGINKLKIKTNVRELSLQANEGKQVTELLTINLELQANLKNGVWQWQNANQIKQGELFIEPVYIELKDDIISINTQGQWSNSDSINVQKVQLIHSDIYDLNVGGVGKQQSGISIDQAHILVNIKDLEEFSTHYITPFTEQTAFEGIKLKGQLQSEIEVQNSSVTQVAVDFSSLDVNDDNKRITIDNAEGILNWSIDPDFLIPSVIKWDQIHIRAIPIDEGQLKLLGKNNSITLIEQTSIPLLGGKLEIKQFNWQRQKDLEPKVFFEGGINNISLQKLTDAFNWTPLSGNISGYIPGVDYENKTLTVNGELRVNVFDGQIKINKLASSGMFTDFSRFNMNMEIDKLDLHAITQKFEVGGMEGRVSGYINNLYLENWSPVTFYAWLGTPENDKSNHRISQKAVENIASIGGGGAADIISKGFLRFFDTFGYEKLGFGCYLYHGVCQLMGAEAARQGFYIVKGGGLPRIDIIGYNPRVDWKVLIERLSRINTTDEVVIQ